MTTPSRVVNPQTPNGQLAGSKRPGESLELSRDGTTKRFQGCSSMRHYTLMSKLGEGTFGEVYKAESRRTGEIIALKKIVRHQEKDGFPVTALREIKILKMLSHPNVLKLEDMALEHSKAKEGAKPPPATVYMVTPFMDHDLSGLLENPTVHLTEAHLKCYMIQLLEGTAYLHKSKILHRDMKAANLLISNEGILQIADFGLARPYDDPPPEPGKGNGEATRGYTQIVVTRWYRPPELLLQLERYTPAIDMWGVGCVFGEMFQKKPILPGSSDLDQVNRIWTLMGSPTEENMPGWSTLRGCEGIKTFPKRHSTLNTAFRDQGSLFISLLGELLKLDWRTRVNAMDALQHPYFRSEPLPSKPGDIPEFQESHELDRRKNREQLIKPPPAPVGGAVGMGHESEFVNGNAPNGSNQYPPRGTFKDRRPYPPPRNGYDHRDQAPYGSRVPPPPPTGGPQSERRPAWERGPPNGLPPRPPVDIPRGGPGYSGPRPHDGPRDRGPPRERPPPYDDSRPRPRGGGAPQVDTYIPSYRPRDEARRGRDDPHRGNEDPYRRDDRGTQRPSDRRDFMDRDGGRRRSRSPDPSRDRERDRNRDSFRR